MRFEYLVYFIFLISLTFIAKIKIYSMYWIYFIGLGISLNILFSVWVIWKFEKDKPRVAELVIKWNLFSICYQVCLFFFFNIEGSNFRWSEIVMVVNIINDVLLTGTFINRFATFREVNILFLCCKISQNLFVGLILYFYFFYFFFHIFE